MAPTEIETRAPWIRRDSMSRPSASQPSGKAHSPPSIQTGGCSRRSRSVSFGIVRREQRCADREQHEREHHQRARDREAVLEEAGEAFRGGERAAIAVPATSVAALTAAPAD